MKYTAILRGINVGGKRKILMADLRQLFKEIGCTDVSTYIQSGNVLFRSEDEGVDWADRIKQTIFEQYGYDVPVIVLSESALRQAIEDNPYYDNEADISKLHLTFLKELPQKDAVTEILTYDFSPDTFQIIEKCVFIYCEGKYHKSKLTNTFFEKKLGVVATTRNWKTVLKLRELLEA